MGNHDAADTEKSDDRELLNRNFYTAMRFADDAEIGRASIDPGLFYQFRYGRDIDFVAIDTTLASDLQVRHFVEHPKHRAFLEAAFAPDGRAAPVRWRIPFTHHPPYCAGPSHDNMDVLVDQVVPLLQEAGVRAMFSGHEHDFQHQRAAGIDYFVSGAAGKVSTDRPDRFDDAHTQAWAAEGHLLIVDVDADRMLVHPITGFDDDGGMRYVTARDPIGHPVGLPITVERR